MAWNGSAGEGAAGSASSAVSKPSHGKGVAAGLAVVVGALLVLLLVVRTRENPEMPEPKLPKQIREVRPAVVSATVETNETVLVAAAEPEPVTNRSTVGMTVRTPTGKTYVIAREIKHDYVYRHDGVEVRDRDIFRHDSERILDAIICCEPGDRFYATFDETRFRADLTQALLDKIEFSDDDDDRERERKQAVIDAKEELRAALERGEDPVQIVADARRQIIKVAEMRDNILNSLAEVRRNAESEEEVNEYIAAANKMLEPYGVRKILTRDETKERVREAVIRWKMRKESRQ